MSEKVSECEIIEIEEILNAFELIHGWKPRVICVEKNGVAIAFKYRPRRKLQSVGSHGWRIGCYTECVIIKNHWTEHEDWKRAVYWEKKGE